jgi:succinate dehydrogenase hydrophobic anchor subunit
MILYQQNFKLVSILRIIHFLRTTYERKKLRIWNILKCSRELFQAWEKCLSNSFSKVCYMVLLLTFFAHESIILKKYMALKIRWPNLIRSQISLNVVFFIVLNLVLFFFLIFCTLFARTLIFFQISFSLKQQI